ncbi:MAG: hypothetical protein ABIG34_02560 [Candidatus Peregrinibacteria bacterium]
MEHKHQHSLLLFFLTFALAALAFIAVVRQARFTASVLGSAPALSTWVS